MSDITKIEKIHTSAGDHEIDARYWGGNETLKTINGESLFGSGNFDIDHFFQIDSPANNNVFNIYKWNPNLNQTLPQIEGSTLTIVNVSIADIDFAGGMSVKYTETESNVTTTYTIPVGISSFVLKKYCCVTFVLVGNGQIVPILPTIESSNAESVGEADKLSTSRSINGIYFDGSSDIHNFGICTTAAGTADKEVNIDGFKLTNYAQIRIKFNNGNTNTGAITLNVNSTGKKSIYYNNTAVTGANFFFDADKIYTLTYNDNWCIEGDWLNTVTATSTNANYPLVFGQSATSGATITSGDKMLYSDSVNSVYYNPSTNVLTAPYLSGISSKTFSTSLLTCSTAASTAAKTISAAGFTLTTGVKVRVKFTYANTAASPTLNINSTGAKSMRYNGVTVTGSNFTFDITNTYELTYDGTYWVISDISSTTDLIYIEQDGDDFAGFSNKMLKFENGTKISIVFSENVGVNAPLLSIIDKNGLYENCYLYYKGEDAKGLFEANKVYTIVLDTSDPDDHKWLLEGDHDIKNYSYVHFNSKNNAGLYSSVPGFLYNGCTVYGIIDTSISTCTANNAHLMSLNDGVYSAEMFKYGESGVVIDGCTTANIPQINRVYLCYYDTDKWFIDIDDSGLEPCKNSQSIMYGTCSSDATASTKVVYVSYNRLNEGDIVWINFTNGNTYTGEQVTMSITTSIGLINTRISTVLDFYNFIGGSGGRVNTNTAYTAGISMLPGAYEFIYLDSKLKYTGNYVADRAPEILVKSDTTGVGAVITFELVKNMHTVFNIGTKPRTLELTIPSASETYSCEFTTGAASMTFRYPSTLKWVNGILPTLEMSTTYHLSIVNNCAAIVAFKTNEPT